jgi:hypothetical protein
VVKKFFTRAIFVLAAKVLKGKKMTIFEHSSGKTRPIELKLHIYNVPSHMYPT